MKNLIKYRWVEGGCLALALDRDTGEIRGLALADGIRAAARLACARAEANIGDACYDSMYRSDPWRFRMLRGGVGR